MSKALEGTSRGVIGGALRTVMAGVVAALMIVLGTAPAQAAQVDVTTLPGYESVTSNSFNFAANGWAGWSCPGTKVVLGAEIIAPAGANFEDFTVFQPAEPGEVFPHNTYTDYGWAMQAKADIGGVKIRLSCADKPAGYTIGKSNPLNFAADGWGGWSAPVGNVVSGGGDDMTRDSGASAARSEIGLEGSVWPHYTFGPNEQGWVVQNGGISTQGSRVYVISLNEPLTPTPTPTASASASPTPSSNTGSGESGASGEGTGADALPTAVPAGEGPGDGTSGAPVSVLALGSLAALGALGLMTWRARRQG